MSHEKRLMLAQTRCEIQALSWTSSLRRKEDWRLESRVCGFSEIASRVNVSMSRRRGTLLGKTCLIIYGRDSAFLRARARGELSCRFIYNALSAGILSAVHNFRRRCSLTLDCACQARP